MSEIPAKPVPTPTAMSQPYWDGVANGELRLQSCGACGTPRHYPRLLCDRCYSDDVKWVTASGRGKIHSWTVAHHPYHAAFVTEVPYTLVLVDLVEGTRALGRWNGDDLKIGDAVEGKFVAREGGSDLVFSPTSG
ncbi:MAG: putative OB-fold protein [Gammaproteobacteria bacterium]|jgi:uncharacterized OB-fold protein